MRNHFVLKLFSSRLTFSQDMTEEERKIMQEHVAYWKDLMNKGYLLVFGPVMDPKGVYGLGVVEADDIEQVNSFIANDPASKISKYEVCPMMAVTPKK